MLTVVAIWDECRPCLITQGKVYSGFVQYWHWAMSSVDIRDNDPYLSSGERTINTELTKLLSINIKVVYISFIPFVRAHTHTCTHAHVYTPIYIYIYIYIYIQHIMACIYTYNKTTHSYLYRIFFKRKLSRLQRKQWTKTLGCHDPVVIRDDEKVMRAWWKYDYGITRGWHSNI